MKKPFTLIRIVILAMLCACNTAYAQHGIKSVSPARTVIDRYGLFELDVSISASRKNPFDRDQVSLAARITNPEGKVETIPAFYTGKKSKWKARYTPVMTGRYSYDLLLKTASGTYNSASYSFDVRPGTKDGFLRKSKNNPFYLVFDSGKPFFGLGHNVAWVTDNNIQVYKKYFSDLKENGCNLTRIWINSPWTLRVENEKIGYYNSKECDKIDSIIRLAEKYGIYIVLTLDSYGSLMPADTGRWHENAWNVNPYNKANGGPCDKPWDFFTDPTAKRCYKNRLRYMVARWSYSPNILAFELWNEVDTPKNWAEEMSSYLKDINPHGQLVTVSLGYPWDNVFDESDIWNISTIDIAQRHIYGDQSEDIIEYLRSTSRIFADRFNKPLLIGEFGMDAGANDKVRDATGAGVALHNSLWAAALSGSFSGSLNWWWAGYVRGKNLYPHYRALRKFLEGVNWDAKDVTFLTTSPVMRTLIEDEKASRSDITITPAKMWGETTYKDFIIHNNGDISGGLVNYYLQGTSKKNIKIDPTFRLNYPEGGKFIIHVGTVSQWGRLIALLDGNKIQSVDFLTGPGKGPWKKSIYLSKYRIYQCIYDTTVELDIPKGEHTLRLINSGKDWIGIKRVTLTDYKSTAYANARAAGMRVGDTMLLWIQNKDYNWQKITGGGQPAEITDASFHVKDIENGSYEIEWWDTFKGTTIRRQTISAENNKLRVLLPAFSKDIACKIKKV